MPAPQPSKELHSLCHEHHLEMRKVELLFETAEPAAHVYACPQPDCGVRYGASTGYFTAPKNGQVDLDMTPRVACPRDGQPMYLAETDPQKRAFRLWRCPQCDSTRTNDVDLVNEVPEQLRS